MGSGAVNVPTIPPASGKSGTAEVFGGKSHAWFGAYAPIISQRSSLWRLLNMPVVAAAGCCSMVLKLWQLTFWVG